MKEAGQSKLRYDLYLNQLMYEKVYSLGSRSEAAELMAMNGIKQVVGIKGGSNDALALNRSVRAIAEDEKQVLYEVSDEVGAPLEAEAAERMSWLLSTRTLVNDIGDREDTFEHLPASLRATRLSEPVYEAISWRTTTAPRVELKFNVGDYVEVLWDQEKTGRPDTAVELLVLFNNQSEGLLVETDEGIMKSLMPNEVSARFEPGELKVDEDGFITLTLLNPKGNPLEIDLIALGLATTP